MLVRASTGFHTRVRDSSWDTIMARKIRDAKLESRTARLRLPVQKKPFTGPALARGIHLLYRRNKGNGTWIAKASNGHGGYSGQRVQVNSEAAAGFAADIAGPMRRAYGVS